MDQNKEEQQPVDYSYNYDYPDWYSTNLEPTRPPKEVILPCDPTATDQLFHICIASISVVVLLGLAVLSRRRTMCPGLATGPSKFPVDFLNQTQNKGVAMAVFGLVFSKLSVLVLAPDPLPLSRDTPMDLKEYMKVLSIFYYPVLFCPLLALGALRSRPGYALGGLLAWVHCGVQVWQKVDCPKTPEHYKYYALLASLPQIACLAFLCVQFPLLFVTGERSGEDLDSSYYKDYVKSVLKSKSSNSGTSIADKPKLLQRILNTLNSYIYRPEKVFHFPLKLAISAFVSFVAIYQVALLLVIMVIPTLHIVRAGIDENIAFLLLGFNIVLSEDRMEVVQIVIYYTWCLEVCYLCAVTLACLLSLIMLMRSMILHRSNLKELYKGDICTAYDRQRTLRPSKVGVVCWMGYMGYQAALICIGMVIQTLVFFICFLFLVFLIIIPILSGKNLLLFQMAAKAWPVWVTLILVVAIQHAAAKFTFVKKDAGTRDLDNRGSLYLLSYLLFLVNILVGLLAFVWRTLISAVFNMVHLSRMDISLLHRSAEPYDPAYCYYVQVLKVEAGQSHPVMKAFCSLLLQAGGEGRAGQEMRNAEEACSSVPPGIPMVQEFRQTRVTDARRLHRRWQLLYTLVHNPILLGARKHFQPQSLDSVLNGTRSNSAKEASNKDGPEMADLPKMAETAAAADA